MPAVPTPPPTPEPTFFCRAAGTGKALHDYHPIKDGQIALSKGDMIDVESVEDDWAFGKNTQTGESGRIPASFVDGIGNYIHSIAKTMNVNAAKLNSLRGGSLNFQTEHDGRNDTPRSSVENHLQSHIDVGCQAAALNTILGTNQFICRNCICSAWYKYTTKYTANAWLSGPRDSMSQHSSNYNMWGVLQMIDGGCNQDALRKLNCYYSTGSPDCTQTDAPTAAPAAAPTAATTAPTTAPTAAPTAAPTGAPTGATTALTAAPTAAPTSAPTAAPNTPSAAPTAAPTNNTQKPTTIVVAAAAPASVTLALPLDVNLTTVTPAELTGIKDALLKVAAALGGFKASDVERIELVQDGKVVTRRRRATNGAVTARIIFKSTANVDVAAAVGSLNTAIAQGAVTVTVTIGGKEITAKVEDLIVFVQTNSAGATTAQVASGLVAVIAGIAALV